MKKHPVAVLISVYKNDKAKQFISAIQSLLQQDYGSKNIRIYLGIDGTISELIESYIENHANVFHKVIRNETNQGLAITLNRLIDSLEDEKYVFRMDSDDIALPYRLRVQIEFMKLHPHVDLCGGSIVEFDESGYAFLLRSYPRNTQESKKYICKASPLAHMTVCFRGSLFKDPKYRYPEVKSSQDIRLWHKTLFEGKNISNLTIPLVLVRMNQSMLKRRSITYGLREFDAFLLATYSLHGFSWRLVYPFARLATRFTPSWMNQLIYKKFRRLLNHSSKDNMPNTKDPILCINDQASNAGIDLAAKRILKELCGLSENKMLAILSPTTTSRRAA